MPRNNGRLMAGLTASGLLVDLLVLPDGALAVGAAPGAPPPALPLDAATLTEQQTQSAALASLAADTAALLALTLNRTYNNNEHLLLAPGQTGAIKTWHQYSVCSFGDTPELECFTLDNGTSTVTLPMPFSTSVTDTALGNGTVTVNNLSTTNYVYIHWNN